jgi:parallel beta-helix repeat protein
MPTANFKTPSRTVLSLSALALLITGAALYAGPLNPPAGPVAPTLKTLTEVEPRTAINATNTPGDADSLFRITQPGSYYLTSNITGVAGRHGIEIAASGVTLDLNGFELSGVATPGFSFAGVRVDTSGLAGICVRNGTVRGWSGGGLDLFSFSPTNCSVTDVRALKNGADGIAIGSSSQVSGCTASFNVGTGIQLSFSCATSRCVVSNNGLNGISGGVTNIIVHCTAYLNGIDGIIGGINSMVSDCVSYDNTDEGFTIGSSGTITGCKASTNGGSGISLQSNASAINCSSHINNLHGISAVARCYIFGNTCVRNGANVNIGSGIYVSGDTCRIEGNNCIENDRGIEIDGAANFVIRNTCSGNDVANWDIAADNVCGPILNRSAVVSAAILGDSAGSSLGTTDANANFTN